MARRSPGEDRYNSWGQDTWTHPDEERYVRDMKAGMDEVRVSLFVPETSTRLHERERDQALIDATDADNECPHGHLPDDPGLLCDCWDQDRTTVGLEPFRRRFEEMEPAVRTGGPWGGPGIQPQDAATAIAIRLGWSSRGKPDGDRVRRVLGLRPTPGTSHGGRRYPTSHRQRVRRETALRLCEVMGLDPAEVGL